MPNPSNSDLVGDIERLLARADEHEFNGTTAKNGDAHQLVKQARTLLPELAQQLEQTEQREAILKRELFDFYVTDYHGSGNADEKAAEYIQRVLTLDEGADHGE